MRDFIAPVPTEDAMEQWCELQNAPLFGELGAHNFRALTGDKSRFLVMVCYDPELDSTMQEIFVKSMGALARRSTTKLPTHVYEKFTFAKLNARLYDEYLLDYGITLDTMPRIMVRDSQQELFYSEPVYTTEVVSYLENITLGTAPYQRDGIYLLPYKVFRFIMSNPVSGAAFVFAFSGLFGVGAWVCCCLPDFDDELYIGEEEEEQLRRENIASLKKNN